MNRNQMMKIMDEVLFSSEAAEYLGVSIQRLNQLVHDKKLVPIKASKSTMLFWKADLDNRAIANVYNTENENKMDNLDIDVPHIRDAILYFTVQQFLQNSDKKTCVFFDEIEKLYGFDFRAGLTTNIPFLSSHLNIHKKQFYDTYVFVKESFTKLSSDVIIVRKGDGLYSKLLEITPDAPPFLFLKGNVHLLDQKSVCVVGSRNASIESMEKTERLVKSFIKRNIIVNAGLAKGIDTATHTAALRHGGKTIAVIGTPINQYYPKENKILQKEIEKKGLVISQFPPCNKVNRWNFPTRNATMSGISLATIIMEAGETSGALKQADYALKQNRIVLIPKSAIDNPLITWPKKYLKRGAHEFITLKDVLVILNQQNLLKGLFDDASEEDNEYVEVD